MNSQEQQKVQHRLLALVPLTLLLALAITLEGCSTVMPMQKRTDEHSTPSAQIKAGLLSGAWTGDAICDAPNGYRSTKRYDVKLTLNHEGRERYSGILTIKGIGANRGVYSQLERIPMTVEPVDGEYRFRTRIFMPFMRSRVRTEFNDKGQISDIHFTTIQRCRSFSVARN